MSDSFANMMGRYSAVAASSQDRRRNADASGSKSKKGTSSGVSYSFRGDDTVGQKRPRDDITEGSEPLDLVLEKKGIASVIFKCMEGSVTHYYHFFFGAMVPLIEYHLKHPSKSFRIITDVGPMKSILCELPLNIVEMLGPVYAEHIDGDNTGTDASNNNMGTSATSEMNGKVKQKALGHDDKSVFRSALPGQTILEAYDKFNSEFYRDSYTVHMSKKSVHAVRKYFARTVPRYIELLPTYDIVLIQRAEDAYYAAACLDRQPIYRTSGAQRRSITNHTELVEALKTKYGTRVFSNLTLERSSIYYQYRIFSNAKVVIAQHGAALANTFFMAQSKNSSSNSNSSNSSSGGSKNSNSSDNAAAAAAAHVIEISPPWSREFQHFANLAHFMNVPHHTILQEADHSAVDIPAILALLDDIYPAVST